MDKFNPIVLTNERSTYFNKKLFQILNEFERKLRKLLYLSSSLKEDEISANTENLETKDLGAILGDTVC